MQRFQQIDFRGLLKTHDLREVWDKVDTDLREKKLDPRSLSIKRLWEQTVGDPGSTLDDQIGIGRTGYIMESAIDTSAFATIVGSVIADRVIAGYNERASVGDQLVTNVPSNKKTERIAGFNALEGVEEVKENMPYQESGMGELYVDVDNLKYGRILAITEEMIMFDQTGQLIVRAGQFGTKARTKRERLILQGVIDANYSAGAAGVYRLNGSYTDLYAAALSTLNTGAGTINTANFGTALNALKNMTDSEGDYISVAEGQLILMCATAVEHTARVLMTSTLAPGTSNNDDNVYKGMATVIANPYNSTSTTWFLGDFKSQFQWQEVWPIQVMRAVPGNEQEFTKDIKAAFKVRFFGGVGAVDHRFVQKQTA